MNSESILQVIDAVPEYIKYIYPGYVTIYVYLFLRGKTLKDNSYVIVKSIAISYLYLSTIEGLRENEWMRMKFNCIFQGLPYSMKLNICLIVLSVLGAYVAYRIVISERVRALLSLFKINTTFYDNEIEVLANFDEGAWLCVYLNDDTIVYEGTLAEKELEEGKRKYLCLRKYYKYYLDDSGKPKEPYIDDNGEEYEEAVVIFYDSIKRIEKRA